MQTAYQLLMQIASMFLLAGVGYLLYRIGRITKEGSKSIGNILVFVILPTVIVKGFLIERTPETVQGVLMSTLLAAVSLAVCVILSRVCFPKDAIASFAAAFSNPGFFGVPLIVALLGSNCVFYIAAFIAFLNLLQFSYGTALITGGQRKVSVRTILTAPFLIAIGVGLILFFTQLPLPSLVSKTIDSIAAMNTPLAMFAVGVYLAQTDIKAMFQKKSLYFASFARLVLIPLAVLAILTLVPEKWHACKLAVLISAACPVGTNVAVYAQLYDKDYCYAVETVVLSTMFSIATIPAIVYLAERLWA